MNGMYLLNISGRVQQIKEGINCVSVNLYLLNKSWARLDKFHQHFILHEYHVSSQNFGET